MGFPPIAPHALLRKAKHVGLVSLPLVRRDALGEPRSFPQAPFAGSIL